MLVEGLMMIVAAIVPDFLMGIITGAGIQGIMMLNCGFFQIPSKLPKIVWKYPMFYISFHKYALQGFYKNEFLGLVLENNPGVGDKTITEAHCSGRPSSLFAIYTCVLRGRPASGSHLLLVGVCPRACSACASASSSTKCCARGRPAPAPHLLAPRQRVAASGLCCASCSLAARLVCDRALRSRSGGTYLAASSSSAHVERLRRSPSRASLSSPSTPVARACRAAPSSLAQECCRGISSSSSFMPGRSC
ncbi:hypothetical protein C2845_PM03G30040 [Panicum miliaceum]|uniref:ABC-2 type transporter transmembrane domain-containing protein n=1 Tax=Panicum miliaceum TaxID=4540 RepID=A0A3L6T8G6_PANMI|nr:hypothetical protein C2845_PM03G30040 [Panicum miliaceum]